MVAALELHAVSSKVCNVDIVPVEVLVAAGVLLLSIVVAIVVQLTGVPQKRCGGNHVSVIGVNDGGGTGTANKGGHGNDGEARKHGWMIEWCGSCKTATTMNNKTMQ